MTPKLPTLTVGDLHALTTSLMATGHRTLPVCATDGRARYPYELYTNEPMPGQIDALLINVHPEAHFAAPYPVPADWPADRVETWNAQADRIKVKFCAFANQHHADVPSSFRMKQALEQIWKCGQPDAAEEHPELATLSPSDLSKHLVQLAGEVLGFIK